MTAIAGIAQKGHVWIGADSAGTDGALNQMLRADSKVFRNGPFLIGISGSFRVGQLLRYSLNVERRSGLNTVDEYMNTTFIETVRKCMRDGGAASQFMDSTDRLDGAFLVGYKGRLFNVGSDYQVGEALCKFDAVGCGASYVNGVLHVTSKSNDPEYRILKSLEAAAAMSAGVSGPFKVMKL